MNSFQAIKCLIWLCLLLPETICLVSFPLDAPPAFAAAWYSLAELQSLSKHLGINGVLTNENLFRSSLDQGLYESIQRDWKKNWMRFRKWMAQGSGGFTEEKTNQTESSILLENDKWSRIKASNLTIGLQVSLDASLQLRPRLLLEIDGCTRLGAASEFESLKKSKLLSSVTQYSSRDGIQSCDQVCPEAAVEMIAHWKKESLPNTPSGLLIYTPQPLSACSAAYLTLMDTFSRQSLDQAFKRLDAHTTWTDGFLSLSVGQDEKECALNLDAALMELPLGNKREMRSLPDGKECEVLLSAINPSDYVEFYRTVFLSSKDDKEAASVSNKQQWPSAEDIIQSNTANSWKNHLAKSCSEWQGLPSIEKTIQIPVLEAQGPFVKDLFSLVEVAFRIASVNPYQSTEFKTNRTWDGLLDKVSRLCSVCHMFPSVSYQSLYESFESIQTNACQRSIFGGLGLRVAQTLDQLRRMPEQMGSRVQRRLTRVDLHGVTEPTYYAERCKDGDVLMFGYVLSKKRSEFVDESGAFFKSKFAIVSDGVSHNRSSFTGSAVWSPELRSFSMKLNLEKRDLQGQYNLKVKLRRDMESRNAKPGLTFNMNIICGYHSDLAALEVNVMPNPLELTLLSFKDLVIPLQTRVPIKRHFLFYDTREHRGVYDSAIFSFLSATSAITLVDHARSLKLNDLKYPAHLKPSISITEACPSDSFGGISETKLLYRNDLVKIVSCLQNDLMLDSLIGSELLEGRVTLDVFLVKSTKFDEKFLLLYFPGDVTAKAMAKVLEYYRLNFGHQLVVYRRSQDKNTAKEILGSLANLGTRKNYDLPDNSLQWIFPFSGHSQTARIVEQQIQASNLCISPSEWSVAQCQDVAEFAAWFRRHSVDLQDTHLPARRDVCSMDFLGTLVPVTYSVLEKKFLSINVRELQERDILAWRNAHMSDYLASFDVLLVQGIPQKKIADGVAELLSKSFKGHAAGNLHIFWKADSVDVKTCLVDEYDSTPIMGCLFVIDKEALIVVNLEDNSDEYLLSNPSKDLPLQSVGIMKRIYVRLCQTRLADCSEYPLPAIYSGTWNHRQEKKASFTEQQRYLETIERQILRKNRVADGSFLKTNRSLNVWVPSETDVLQIPDDLLYTPDAKQHHLFDWLSETEKLVRKRWPFSSQLSEPGIGNWVATLSGITTPLSVEAMSFDTAMRSPNCLYGKVGRCSFTDPPCSGFQAVNGIQLKPFTI